ncbi:MAG: sugar ABC transporter permease [Clostridiales bacterium]|nr:sugar ABC transporter permease [Clostridiales bacterium]
MKRKKRSGFTSSSAISMTARPIRKFFPLFMGPTLAAFIIGFIYPFLQGLYLSFCSFTTTSDAEFIGIGNYVKALKDASFVHAFWYTALYAVVSLVLINVIAFFIAFALTRHIRGVNLFRTAFFMPNLIGGIVLGYIWNMIFNGILSRFNTSILLETKYGFWGLIIVMCWQQIGYMMIIYIAGIQALPEDMMEAAKIDGATGWQTLTKVIIPNVMPSITICMFLSLSNGFKLFDQNLALTGGQPYTWQADGTVVKTTEMLALNIYNTFYGQSASSRGVAQAKAVLFFILVAAISLIQLRVTRSREVDQS